MSENSDKINTRADAINNKGRKLTDKQLLVYFYYLANSHRNPSGAEHYRYLYMKDINKTAFAAEAGMAIRTVRNAEIALEAVHYIEIDKEKRIIRIVDSPLYSWIPLNTLKNLVHLAHSFGGDLVRLYAALHYYKAQPQEFSASTWVYAFGMSETHQSSYARIQFLLYVLKLYGFIEYTEVKRTTTAHKSYIAYTDVRVIEPEELCEYDEAGAPLSKLAEDYRKVLNLNP